MIDVQDLTKRYGKHLALRGISFHVGRGEVVGFLGPNGAGKSTTMKILTGLIPSSSGSARVAGLDVLERPLEVRRHIGYLPEVPPLYPEMSVQRYLLFVAELRGVPRARRRKALDRAVERCGLGEVIGRQVRHLSKGYRQRVGLAQAIIHEPDLLILDEPTVGLDPRQVVEIRAIVRDLGEDRTVFLCSHILPEVRATCGRVLIINRGRLVAEGALEELEREGSTRLRLVLSEPPEDLKSSLMRLPGVEEVEPEEGEGRGFTVTTDGSSETRVSLAAHVVQGGWGLEELSPIRASLEEVFLRSVMRDEDSA
jgi:ABC-2 type transport system ATP-binding protein